MAQFKWDQKLICLSPLTTLHIFSYGGPPEEEGLCLSTRGHVMVPKPQYGRFEGGGLGNVNCQLLDKADMYQMSRLPLQTVCV